MSRPLRCLIIGHQCLPEIERPLQFVFRTCPNLPPTSAMLSRRGDPRVIHQNIYPTEFFQDLGADFLHGGMVGDVDGIAFAVSRSQLVDFCCFFCALASVRLTEATRAPSLASRSAMASHPRPAPVTTATWFSNLMKSKICGTAMEDNVEIQEPHGVRKIKR